MLQQIIGECKEYGATLVAVSKTKSNEEILNVYNEGQRHFGENKVQELVLKREQLPKNIQWHLIGHLQKNKVKSIRTLNHVCSNRKFKIKNFQTPIFF